MGKIDLHLHTTASDGVFTPTQVVKAALERRLTVIAITDHDTTAGIEEAQKSAQNSGLQVIAGIELNCENDTRSLDILGYYLDMGDLVFQKKLTSIRQYRYERAVQIIEKLKNLDIHITIEQVKTIAKTETITRPHIGRALMEVGAVRSLQEAFDLYISSKGPAYVPRYKLLPQEAIALIHSVGGVAVLAHPIRYQKPMSIIAELAEYGLDGVEVYYPDHKSNFRYELRQVAKQHGLLITGGSDFHFPDGDGKLRLGQQYVPADTIEQLDLRRQRYLKTAKD